MEFEVKQYQQLKYLIRYPKQYQKGDRCPVILALHGAGSRGRDIELLYDQRILLAAERDEAFPFVIVMPQCNQNTWFDHFETLKDFAAKIAGEPFTDPARYYLVGVSMGAYATWQLAMSMPELFAAIIPICGGGMYWNASRLVNVPVWAFHGEKDPTVFVEESIKMVQAVNKAGGKAELTLYPEHGHDVWTDTFRNPRTFEWLLEHKNSNALQIADKYKDGTLYG